MQCFFDIVNLISRQRSCKKAVILIGVKRHGQLEDQLCVPHVCESRYLGSLANGVRRSRVKYREDGG